MNQRSPVFTCISWSFLVTATVVLLGHLSASTELIGSIQSAVNSSKSSYEGVRIDTIAISNRNVFDTLDSRYNRFPFRTANRLHIVTRARVVRNECLLEVGTPFSTELAEETARNLRTRLILYDAWVEAEHLPDGRLLVRIVTVDQWSLMAGFHAHRDANRTYFELSLEERNLLGLNQYLSFNYFYPEQETNYYRASYREPRLLGLRYAFDAIVRTDPTDGLEYLAVSHPYYSLNQSFSWSLHTDWSKGRTDYYMDNRKVGESHSNGDETGLAVERRWGSYHDKIAISSDYLYRSRRSKDKMVLDSGVEVTFPQDSVFHRFGIGGGLYRIVYSTVKRVNGFGYTEDIDLGQSVAVGYKKAYSGGSRSPLYDQVDLQIGSSFLMGSNLALLSYDRTVWFVHGAKARQASRLVARCYNTHLSFLTIATRVSYQTDKRDGENSSLHLGGDTGVRGYDQYSRTGNRLLVSNLETRFFPGLEILSVQWGAALFVDAGRTYKPGEKFTLKNMEVSVGAGLRISFEKAAKTELGRWDAVYTRDGKWQISFGSGQYF